LKDRAIYLTNTAVQALQDYLVVRGMAATDHVFLYRHKAVNKDLIRARIKGSGERTGVAVSPHRLRHTCATQLLNAGCRVTSIQKLFGHRQLGTTMIYAKAHDRNVSADYYTAMARIETRLELDAGLQADEPLTIHPFMRTALLSLANHLAEPQLESEARLELVKQMRGVLEGKMMEAVVG